MTKRTAKNETQSASDSAADGRNSHKIDVVPAPGYVLVDQTLVERDWLLLVAPDSSGDCAPNATLRLSRSGVPGRRIEKIDLEFENPDNIFRANIRIFGDPSYTFVALHPANLSWTGLENHKGPLASCVTILEVLPGGRELRVCFKCEEVEAGALTFNITDTLSNILVTEDPSVAVRKKNGD
ncbi:hypothetical protein [Arenicella xantha]|uniref:Uncharacterized protein n=1 Tax=Arenicella xantha TaxID=644221 RepID=A0A395JL16_9GAMM|nr:hypothetical protein [Arenicella xantha]RBP51279.1 hypothetical protein DFR28_102698 [Arenicella xantha]